MRYGVLDGGKRLRPFLVCAAADLFKVPRDRALRAAGAEVSSARTIAEAHDGTLLAQDRADGQHEVELRARRHAIEDALEHDDLQVIS